MVVLGGSPAVVGGANMKGLAVQVITGRWFAIFASFLIMSANGTGYMFGLYSSDMKMALGYDQTTLNLVSFFKDIGATVGVIAGFINEFFPPWVVLAIGAVLNFFGYFMMWLAITQRIPKPEVWQMCLYICLAAHSQTYAITGVLITSVKNFPKSRGVVLGILSGYVGLSGAIITQLYYAFYYNDTKALVLLLAWLPATISLAFLLRTIRYMTPVRHPNELKVFYKFLYISLALATFLMLMIILQRKFHFSRNQYCSSATIVLFLLLLPITIVYMEEYKTWHLNQLALEERVNNILVTDVDNDTNNNKNPLCDTYKEKKEVKWWENIFRPPKRGEDYTILQAIFSVDMIILFTTIICTVGGTLTAINNLGQIGMSLRYPMSSISTFVSLVSIWSYLGRVFSGFVSEYYLAKYKFPRPLMLALIYLFSCVGHLLIAFDVKNGLYVASVIIGFSFGAQWPLILAIISEIFGLKYYSTLSNFAGSTSPIGLYILNTRITGQLYDKEAKRQLTRLGLERKEGQELNCDGINCFKMSFIIITASTFFGAFVTLILAFRTRKFYNGDIYKKFREAEMTPTRTETEAETAAELPENGNHKEEEANGGMQLGMKGN